MLKCAACGAEVEFSTESESEEIVCPGCEVLVRRRPGDRRMAMPVGMDLPEEFQPLDLKALGKQSDLLVGRYNKRSGEGKPLPETMSTQVDMTLAKALESLAQTIGHLDERLSAQEQRSGGAPPPKQEATPEVGNANGQRAEATVLSVEPEQIVQLDPDEEDGKARPLGASVLVRREAAREAHHFRRESQKHWDDRGREEVKVGWFATLMEKAPKTTVTLTVLFSLGVVAASIFWAEFGGLFDGAPPEVTGGLETSAVGKLHRDDPEAAQAEMTARAYLSATSAKVAKPFVFQSGKVGRKFEELFQPVTSPDNYDLDLKSRAVARGGQSWFTFRVTMEDEAPRTLVVLPEGTMPKVLWEFFAEVGDMSWEEFMEKRPSEPAMMRVWAYKGERYESPYAREKWQCYVLHDYSEQFILYGYAKRNEKEDWRLSDALANRAVKFGRRDEVMAQLELSFMTELTRTGTDREYVAEIKGVPVTSWLPVDFAPRSTVDK